MKIKDKNWTFVYSEGHSMLLNELFFRAFTNYPAIPGIFKEMIYINKQGLEVCHVPWSEIIRVKEQGKFFFRATYREEFQSAIKQCAKDFSLFWEEYKKVDFSVINNQELTHIFEKYIEHLEPMLAYYQVSGGRSYTVLEEYVKKKMAKYFKSNDLERAYSTVLTSAVLDLLALEDIALLKLAQGKITKNKLIVHAKNYAYAYLCTYDNKEVILSLQKRIADLKKYYRNHSVYLSNHRAAKTRLIKEQKKIVSKFENQKKLVTIIEFLRQQGKLRFDYKEWFFGAEYKFLDLFKEISSRIGLSLEDYMYSYRINDTLEFLKSGKKLSKSERSSRRDIFIFLQINKKKFFYAGKKAKKIEQDVFPEQTKFLQQVSGNVANTGKVTGPAKIILPKNFEYLQKVIKDFKEGEILITTMTQPNLVVIMKKAVAIVTNQGGITSHAAVLSRELGIPCIVGTLTATEVFKDGDMIEVDATKGIVKKLG